VEYTRTKEVLVTAPVIEPVSIDEQRRHCRIFHTDDDDYISSCIVAARKRLESACWSSFITQTWTYYWDRFYTRMFLPRPPLRYGIAVASVTAFQYCGPSSTGTVNYTSVGASLWEVSAEDQQPFIRVQYLQTLPTLRGYHDDVLATVKSGYGDAASDVPEPIRHAIKLYAGMLYLHRGDEPFEIPNAVWDLLTDYRFHRV
jgi:uncharacterized phiE125 gp8 family phage protein